MASSNGPQSCWTQEPRRRLISDSRAAGAGWPWQHGQGLDTGRKPRAPAESWAEQVCHTDGEVGTSGPEVTQLRSGHRVFRVPSSRKTGTWTHSKDGCTSSKPHERTSPSSTPSTQPKGHRPGQAGTRKTRQGRCGWKAGANPDSRDHVRGARAGHPAPLGSSVPRVSWTDPWGRPSHSRTESPCASGPGWVACVKISALPLIEP